LNDHVVRRVVWHATSAWWVIIYVSKLQPVSANLPNFSHSQNSPTYLSLSRGKSQQNCNIMATRSKIGTAATRASTRTKTPIPPPSPPAGIKTIRARLPSKTIAQNEASKTRTTGRKPLANRANSPDAKLPAAKKVASTKQARADHSFTTEREPVMVDYV
jgi:hypothetical protein